MRKHFSIEQSENMEDKILTGRIKGVYINEVTKLAKKKNFVNFKKEPNINKTLNFILKDYFF